MSKRDGREQVVMKSAAHRVVTNALSSGALVRQPCEVCGWTPAHAHHDDYSKPLEVRWLCRRHHELHHNPDGVSRMPARSWYPK